MAPSGRALGYFAAGVSGLVGGLLGSFVHSFTWYAVPVGLGTALALTLSIFTTARIATRSRLGAAVAVASWLVPVLVLTVRRAEGDLIIAGTALGYAWLVGGTLLAGCAVAWPDAGARRRRWPEPSARERTGR